MTRRITFLLIAFCVILTRCSFSQDRLSRERTVFGTFAPMDYDRCLNRHLFDIDPKDPPILLGAVYKPSFEKEWALWIERVAKGAYSVVLAEPDSPLSEAYSQSKSSNNRRVEVARITKSISSDDLVLLDSIVTKMIETAEPVSRFGVDGRTMSFFHDGFGAEIYEADNGSRAERLCNLFISLRSFLKAPAQKDSWQLKQFRTRLVELSKELAIQ
jgi:hypothetical protein